MRPTWVTVDLDAIAHNVGVLREAATPAQLCAVVKANAYGHGAVAVAGAALRGGATWLAVAFVAEAIELRDAGIDAPILVLSEPRPYEFAGALEHRLRVTVYTTEGVQAAECAATGAKTSWPVQLKVNTGMNRVGATPADVVALARRIVTSEALTLEAVWTHSAVADEPSNSFTDAQLDRFNEVLELLHTEGIAPLLRHAANSAGAIAHARSRFDLVRCGIGIYGIAPSNELEGAIGLRPALSLRSEVVFVHDVDAGDTVSYGRRWQAGGPTRVATVPIGYADGVRRSYGLDGGQVLVRGRRHRIIGVITMDQLMIDVSDSDVAVGDEVILIGTQGDESIGANDVAAVLGTIGYEVTCALSAAGSASMHRRRDVSSLALPIAGVRVGQHTDAVARTGCTVVLFPPGSVASGEVRGGAPATREFALLDPTKTVATIDAVVLCGGSAFGLAAADGVMQWCAANGRGFETAAGRVPIVVAMALFDLMQGDGQVRPTALDGFAAAEMASEGQVAAGAVGAGTGATIGKWRGADHVRPGGLGVAVVRRDDLVAAAIVAVNAVGDIDDGTFGRDIAAGTFRWPEPPEKFGQPAAAADTSTAHDPTNTTIGVIITNARLDKVGCQLLAQSGHDGLARALFPAHARSDGDALVAVSVPDVDAPPVDHTPGGPLDVTRILASVAVERAKCVR